MAFPKFPYTDFHRLNADWILEKLRELWTAITQKSEEVDEAVETVETYGDRLTAAENDIDTLENSCVVYTGIQDLTTVQKSTARLNIGAAASSAIPDVSDVVRTSAQSLTDAQKTQARTNIGAAASSAIPDVSDVVRYSSQSLTDGQKTQARSNIGAAASSAIPDVSDVVRTSAQSLTDAQKTQARSNIGAVDAVDVGAQISLIPAVLFEPQTLSTPEKTQARSNIGAAFIADVQDLGFVAPFNVFIVETAANTFTCLQTLEDIVTAVQHEAPVIVNLKPYGGSSELNYRGLAYFPSADAGGYTGPMVCDLFAFNSPDNIANSTGYHVHLSSVGGADVLTVTPYNFRTVPETQATDNGKSLVAGVTGIPEWKDMSPLVVTFSGTDVGGDSACDKTWSQIQSASNIVVRWYNTSKGIYYYLNLIDARQGSSDIYIAGDRGANSEITCYIYNDGTIEINTE